MTTKIFDGRAIKIESQITDALMAHFSRENTIDAWIPDHLIKLNNPSRSVHRTLFSQKKSIGAGETREIRLCLTGSDHVKMLALLDTMTSQVDGRTATKTISEYHLTALTNVIEIMLSEIDQLEAESNKDGIAEDYSDSSVFVELKGDQNLESQKQVAPDRPRG